MEYDDYSILKVVFQDDCFQSEPYLVFFRNQNCRSSKESLWKHCKTCSHRSSRSSKVAMPFFLNISRWLAQNFCGDKSLIPLVVQNSHVVVTIIDYIHHYFRIRNAFLWLWFHIPLDRIITTFGMSSADWKVILKLRKGSKQLERWKELSAMTDSFFWCVLWKCNLFRWDVIDWRFRFLRDLYGPQNPARPESTRNTSVSGASQLGDISRGTPRAMANSGPV